MNCDLCSVRTDKPTWDGPDVDHVVDGSGDQLPRIVPSDMLEHLALQIHLTRLITVVENARVLKKQDRPTAETPDPNGTVVATEKQRHYNFWEINGNSAGVPIWEHGKKNVSQKKSPPVND